jgi:hypothetical protein
VKCCSGLLACELPLDGGLVLIDAAVPCASLFSQGGDIFDPSFAEALGKRVVWAVLMGGCQSYVST